MHGPVGGSRLAKKRPFPLLLRLRRVSCVPARRCLWCVVRISRPLFSSARLGIFYITLPAQVCPLASENPIHFWWLVSVWRRRQLHSPPSQSVLWMLMTFRYSAGNLSGGSPFLQRLAVSTLRGDQEVGHVKLVKVKSPRAISYGLCCL